MKSSVKNNYLLNMIYQILAMIVPFVTTPYIARVLNVEQIGIYNYTFSVVNIFVNIIMNGTSQYGLREIAYHPERLKKNTELLFELTILKLCFFSIAMLPYIVVILCSAQREREIYVIHLLLLLGHVVDLTWFYQGYEEFKTIVIRNIIVKLLGVFMIYGFVKSPKDFYLYVMINAASLAVGNISLWFGIRRYADFKEKMDIKILKHLKPCMIFFVPTVASILYAYLDKILLGIISNENEVAYYSQAEKIVKMLITVITAMESVLLPRLSYYIKNGMRGEAQAYMRKGIQFVFFIGMPLMAGMFFIAPYFIPVFLGSGYKNSIGNARILSFLILSIGLASVIGAATLIPMGKQIIYNKIIITASIANCVMDFAFIPLFRSYGASAATVIAETFITVCILYNIREYVHIREIIHAGKKYLFASVVMLVILTGCRRLFRANVLSIILIGVLGASIYFSTLVLLKDVLIFGIIKNICHRITKNRMEG